MYGGMPYLVNETTDAGKIEYLQNEKKQDLIDVFQKIYFDGGKGLIKNEKFLFDKKIIEELEKDYHLAVFTGRPKQEALFALKNAGVEEYFYPVITMDDLPADRQKPDTLGIEKVISRITLIAGICFMTLAVLIKII